MTRGAAGSMVPHVPRKAYEVERISRTVTRLLVYADNPADARHRSADEGTALDSESEVRGFGAVHRRPSEDR